jgi:glucose/arabinose dehydrogenase
MSYQSRKSRALRRFRPMVSDALEGRNLLSTLTITPRDSRAVPLVRSEGGVVAAARAGHHKRHHNVVEKASFTSGPRLAATPAAPNVEIRKGYTLSLVAGGLNFPSAITFGPGGQIWVAEAGFLPQNGPRILQVNSDGTSTPILAANQLPPGTLLGPLTGLTYHQGWLWITHLQQGVKGLDVGAISKFQPADPVQSFQTVITNLPSFGGGYTFKVVFNRQGQAFFGEGTVTNSGVVDTGDLMPGNQELLATGPQTQAFHDYAPVTLTLSGVSYTSQDPMTGATVVTAPFHTFGSGPVAPGTIVPATSPSTPQNGIIAGNGAIYSFKPNAQDPTSTIQLVAWGFRQPDGLILDPHHPNELYVTNNGIDLNGGVRVVNNDDDTLSAINTRGKVQFFGWPDYFHNPKTGAILPVTAPVFRVDTQLQPILDSSFSSRLKVKPAASVLGYHVSADQIDFSTSRQFGLTGQLFVAESGAEVPLSGATQFTGYQVVSVNPRSGRSTAFVTHTSSDPNALLNPTGFNKPVDVKFLGNRMYIVDIGSFEPGIGVTVPSTGKVWVVTRSRSGATA